MRGLRCSFVSCLGCLALGAVGCGVCTEVPILSDAGSTGSLLESTSQALWDIIADGGQGAGGAFQNVRSGELTVTLSGKARSDPQCLYIDSEFADLRIFMACPPLAGTYALSSLQATACDESNTCGSLVGWAEVQQYTPLCADYSCGSIGLNLTLVTADGGGPSISGAASVWVAYAGLKQECSAGEGITD